MANKRRVQIGGVGVRDKNNRTQKEKKFQKEEKEEGVDEKKIKAERNTVILPDICVSFSTPLFVFSVQQNQYPHNQREFSPVSFDIKTIFFFSTANLWKQ